MSIYSGGCEDDKGHGRHAAVRLRRHGKGDQAHETVNKQI